jgi:GTP cyclohydrolase I
METDEYVPVLLETIYEKRETTNYVQITYTGMSLCPCSREMSLLEHNLTDDERHALETARLPQSLQNKLRLVGFGAHNQKSIVEIKVDLSSTSNPPIRELLYVAERAVSSPVFSILRREDEKYLTESSYAGISVDGAGGLINIENTGAKFVEDIARQAADTLNKEYLDKKINDYVIVVNNQESIHSHDIAATAIISAGRGLR